MLISKIYDSVEDPYFNKIDKRWRIHATLNNVRHTMLLAKFIIQEHIGRLLTKDEEVDHIDENKLNDHINNLQILNHKENTNKSNRVYFKDIEEICFLCTRKIILNTKQQAAHNNKKKNGQATPFCSRRCISQYARSCQI